MILTLDKIKEVVESVTCVDILNKTNKREVADAKKIFSYLSYRYVPSVNNRLIGEYLGVDHSTVVAQRNGANDLIKVDDKFKTKLVSCMDILGLKKTEVNLDSIRFLIDRIEKKTGKKVVLM